MSKRKKVIEEDSDDSDDSSGSEPTYAVDKILAERVGRTGETKYLIKWVGYEEHECTWEPVEHIARGHEAIFQRWREDQENERNGFAAPFDVKAFEKRKRLKLRELKLGEKKKKEKIPSQASPSRRGGLFVSDSEEGADSPVPGAVISSNADGKRLSNASTNGNAQEQTAQNAPDLGTATSTSIIDHGKAEDNQKKRKASDSPVHPQAAEKRARRDEPAKSVLQSVAMPGGTAPNHSPSPTRLPLDIISIEADIAPLEGVDEQSDLVRLPDSAGQLLGMEPAAFTPDGPELPPSTNENLIRDHSAPESTSPTSAKSGKITITVKKNPDKALRSNKVVFTDKESAPPHRKHTDGRMFAPSHIMNRNKLLEDGKAPDASKVQLVNPADMVRSSKGRQHSLDQSSSKDITNVRRTSTGDGPSASKSKAPSTSPYAHSIPLVCSYYYSDRICPAGDGVCRFLHDKNAKHDLAGETLQAQAMEKNDNWFKFHEPVIVCPHYFSSNKCRNGVHCYWAHWKPLHGAWRFNNHKTHKVKTCPYWKVGKCFKTAEECQFAHEDLDKVAHISNPLRRQASWPGPAPDPGTPKAELTCPFWFEATYEQGRPCTKGVDCLCAHELKTWIAWNPATGRAQRAISPRLFATSDRPEPPARALVNVNAAMDLDDGQDTPPTVVLPAGAPIAELPRTAPDIAKLSITAEPQSAVPRTVTVQDFKDQPGTFTVILVVAGHMIPMRFSNLSTDLEKFLRNILGQGDRKIRPHCALLDDWETFSANQIVSNGKIMPLETEGVARLQAELADHLAQEKSMLTWSHETTMIRFFPARQFDVVKKGGIPDSTLGYEVLSLTSSIPDCDWMSVPDSFADIGSWFLATFNMPWEDLFKWWSKHNGLQHHVLLVFYEDRVAEVEALQRALRLLGILVYDANVGGSWSQFQQHEEGAIIFDDRVFDFKMLPNFTHVLRKKVNIFELDTDNSELRLKEILKHGHTVFLTDDLLQKEPASLLKVFQGVCERNKGKAPGMETWRIFARPGLRDWLFELAGQTEGVDQPDESSRHGKLVISTEAMFPRDSHHEASKFTDSTIFEDDQLIGYAQLYKDDPAAACELLFESYDVCTRTNREYCRHWIVIHPDTKEDHAKVKQWKERYAQMWFMTVRQFHDQVLRKQQPAGTKA